MIAADSKRTKFALSIAALALVLLVAALPYAAGYADYRKTILRILLDRWFDAHSTTWQYGALVPFVVGWLVWRRRDDLVKAPLVPSMLGLPIILAAMFSYFVGFKANNYYFGFLAVQLFMLGAVLWMLGTRCLGILRFPWLVLGFMWPLVFLEDRIGFPMRLIATKGISLIAAFVHAPVIAEGTSIFSASQNQDIGSWMTLKIDGPCSGMNTLFALLFVGLIFSWFVQRTDLRRALLFACCIPLALVGNMARIALLIGGCALFGQDFAVGNEQNHMTTYHMLTGLMVFPFLVAGLQMISRLMDKTLRSQSNASSAAALHA